VIVEGYTDVMACHLAGVPTAIATCGTAFGADHARMLRRLLMDQNEFRGEVIFTFDGDEAGQKAALRAFDEDQRFATQTFVAIQPDGMDPCELRMARGDEGVRDLVASRVPLFEFAIRSAIERHNLDTAEGRVAALDAAAPIVAGIRDRALRQAYAVNLDRWLGFMDERLVLHRVAEAADRAGRTKDRDARRSTNRPANTSDDAVQRATNGSDGARPAKDVPPDPRDPVVRLEREALKIAIQHPDIAGPAFDALDPGSFVVPQHMAVRVAIGEAGGTTEAPPTERWVALVRDHAAAPEIKALLSALAVEPLLSSVDSVQGYADAVLARVAEVAVTRRVTALKSRLQRVNPVEEQESYNRMFGQLVALEQERIRLRERAIGGL
jgi:DNA primase